MALGQGGGTGYPFWLKVVAWVLHLLRLLRVSDSLRVALGIAFVAEFSIGWALQILAGLMLIATALVSVIPLPEPAINQR